MWERITAALATLGPSALALGEGSLTGTKHESFLMMWWAAQVEMWERITAALATLGPSALALGEDSLTGAAASELQPEQLVEYEGMLVSANAAQRRRWSISSAAAYIE